MVQFSRLVAERWQVSEAAATALCTSFEQGDWAFYVAEYVPVVAAELELGQVWEVFDFLSEIAALAPKKKRLLNALQKDGTLSDMLQRRIDACVDPFELDDMMIVHRPNPRSRAQLALSMGLGPLADILQRQEGGSSPEALAQEHVGKHPSLKTVEDVLRGAKDILAERFAYDETARAMAREFCAEDGYLIVVPRDRKDPQFASYRDRELPIKEIPQDEVLKLLWAEDQKLVRVKLGVQLFRITEVLRQHFIENPDSPVFDLICAVIDDCWERLLETIVERDIKEKLRHQAYAWASRTIAKALPQQDAGAESGILVASGMDPTGRPVCVALNGEGRLLGASRDQTPATAGAPSDRLGKFLLRYRPARLLVVREAPGGAMAEQVVRATAARELCSAEVAVVDSPGPNGIGEAAWIREKCADLDADMRRVYGAALIWLKPLGLVAEIGPQYFDIHPLQRYLPSERVSAVIGRAAAERTLHRGVPVREIGDSALAQYPGMPSGLPAAIRAHDIAEPISDRGELLKVEGMTEAIYRNIAGYVVLPTAANPLDTTRVHPYFYQRLEEAARDLKVSIEGMVVNPGVLKSYVCDDYVWQLYVRKHVCAQLAVGQRVGQSRQMPRRKLRLEELHEGMVVQGRVTNISPFGAFVNINAVCDGLVHISQLADTYVENPSQVVSVGDTVNVRVLKVDPQKRRISLSMKGMGGNAPRVRPSASHITSLIDHFSNR